MGNDQGGHIPSKPGSERILDNSVGLIIYWASLKECGGRLVDETRYQWQKWLGI
jgi:hypothetical protein